MNELEQFLSLPDIDSLTKEIVVSERIGKVTIKAMNTDEYKDCMNKCKSKTTKKGTDFDIAKFNLLVTTSQTVKPDFNNAEFLHKTNCASGTEFVRKKLLVGEIATIANEVLKLSGFDSDINEDVEEAKN